MNPARKEYRVKVVVVGHQGVGKTSIIKRYVSNYFSKNYKATVGVDFAVKVVDWDPTTRVHLQLWDVAGQERFGSMTHVYYRNAIGALIVYDVSVPGSFAAVEEWRKDIIEKLDQHPKEPKIPILLVGNKTDTVLNKDYPVSLASAQHYAKENGLIGVSLVSAKENHGVEEAIQTLMSHIIKYLQQDAGEDDHAQYATNEGGRVRLSSESKQDQAKRRDSMCCIIGGDREDRGN